MVLKVLICDERPLVKTALHGLLTGESDLDVVGSADTAAQARRMVRDEAPDVVVTGLRPGGAIDTEFVSDVVHEPGVDPAVVVYTPNADAGSDVDDVLRAGADGVIAAGAGRQELLMAVRAVGRGQALLGPAAARRLVDWFRAYSPGHNRELLGPATALTPREREILQLLAAGLSVREIADRLVIGVATVRTHLYRLRVKLDARDRAQLVAYAHQAGLLLDQ